MYTTFLGEKLHKKGFLGRCGNMVNKICRPRQ